MTIRFIIMGVLLLSWGASAQVAAGTENGPTRSEKLCTNSFPSTDNATRTRMPTDADKALGVGSFNSVDLPNVSRLSDGFHFQGRSGLDLHTGEIGDYNKKDIYAVGPDDKNNYAIFARNKAEPYNDHDDAEAASSSTAEQYSDILIARGLLTNGGIICPSVESAHYQPHFRAVTEGQVLCIRTRDKKAIATLQVNALCGRGEGQEGGIVVSWAAQLIPNDTSALITFSPTPQQTKP